MLIEFIGSPGSGKSTLMAVSIEFFRQKGANVISRWDARRLYAERSLIGRLSSFVSRPGKERVVIRFYNYFRDRERRKFEQTHSDLIAYVKKSLHNRPLQAGVEERRILHYYENMIMQYGVLTALQRAGDVLIFDEGFVHRVVQLNVSDVETPDPMQVKAYLELAPWPDLLVYIQAPPEVCQQRIRQRGQVSYLGTLDENRLARFLANTQTVIQLAVDHIRQKGCAVIEVDNSQDDLARAAAEIQDKLSRLLQY